MCHELVCVTNLCVDADKKAAQDEAFAFDRTASRLQDMMSESH